MILADHPGITGIPTTEQGTQWVYRMPRSLLTPPASILQRANDALWRIRRLDGRILIEIQPPDYDNTWLSIYLVESSTGGVCLAANIDFVMAWALAVPEWMVRNNFILVMGLVTGHPKLVHGICGNWPDDAQLEWTSMPGDAQPHWLVLLSIPHRRWSEFNNPNADLWQAVQPLTEPGPLHGVLNLCFDLYREAEEESTSIGFLKRSARSVVQGIRLFLDQQVEEAEEHLKNTLLQVLSPPGLPKVGSSRTSLIKPSVFRVFEGQ